MSGTIEKQALDIQNENEWIKVLFDATPLACRLMKRLGNGEFEPLECNEASVELFNFRDKKEFKERYFETYPEYQPNGRNSIEEGIKYLEKAYVEGSCVVNFYFQAIDGAPFPTEVTLVRVKYGGDDVIAGYTRDMREHKKMMDDIARQGNLLYVINHVAALLLAATNEEKFEASLLEGMEFIGRCLEADCVQIWPSATHDGTLNFFLKYQWLSEIGRQAAPVAIGSAIPCSARWQALFLRGECLNSPIAELPQEDQNLLRPLGLLSTVSIPLFYRDTLWGVFCVDDCHQERHFAESEIGILHSAGLMLVNAIKRNEQAALIRDVHERTQLLLDKTPLAINFLDRDCKVFDCNEEALRLFNWKDKQEYMAHFLDASPEYQPDGSRSRDMIPVNINKAFEEGMCGFEWEHQTSDGIPMPTEVTLVRVTYAGDYAVAGYVRDLREYKKMMRDIRESAVKLEAALRDTQRANNAKSDFLANMSHEMRTPLNAIIGLSGLSLESGGLDEETCSNLEKIYNSGEMLLSIVNDILDISKIEAGKMELVEVDYDVPSLINDAVTQNILRIGEKPITFKLAIGEDIFSRLYGDDLRVRQIMNNLLSNAIKYTQEGTVELGVRCVRDNGRVWVTIRVKDTGTGIRPEDLGALFHDYAQVDLKANRKTEGTGLGLQITKNLAEMMHGTIDVESEYGKGSVVTVRIAQKFISDVHIGQEVVDSLKNFRYVDAKRGRNAQLKRISLPYARVLVVDDNLTNLVVAKGLLKPYGMQVDCVTDGQQAIDAIRSASVRYNAVFMDHMMPGIDGVEATRIIREEIGTEYAANVPIIAFSANAIVGNEAMFLSKGFQAFISKPIEIAQLDEVIHRWVRDKDQEERLLEQKKRDEQESPVTSGGETQRSGAARRSGIDRRALGMGSHALNIGKGIGRFDGNRNAYFEVLRSFATNTSPLLELMKDVGREQLADYTIIVHGIKGASRSIGADSFANVAERLEVAAKAGDFEFISTHNASFLQSAWQLISEINDMLARVYPEKSKQKKDKPDMDLLKKLLDACKCFDTDAIDKALTELDLYEYESGGDLIDVILKSANQYNFKEIKEKLIALFSKQEVQNE